MVQTLPFVLAATAALGAVSTLAAPVIESTPYGLAARELEVAELISRELERRQFGLQGIINAVTKTVPKVVGSSKGPTSGLRSMVKSEAKSGLHQEKDNKGKGKVVGQVLMGGFATRDLESQDFALERRQFGLQGIINAVTRTAPKVVGASKGPTSGVRSMVKSEAKAGLHQEKDNKGKGKIVGMALPASFVTRDLESPYEMVEREYDDGAMTYAREYVFDELD